MKVSTRMRFKCIKVGIVKKFKKLIGVNLKILPKRQAIKVVIKRIGLYSDVNENIELRLGDYLILYYTIIAFEWKIYIL